MKHVVLKLKYEETFQVIEVYSPKDIIKRRVRDVRQIFLIDDVVGTYAVNPILAEKWERYDKKIQHCLNMNPGNMKILFTLRKQVVNDRKFSNFSSIISKNIVDLEDGQIALSKEEKKHILTKHLKIKDMESGITENDVEEACASDYAFPLLCRIVSSDKERLKNIVKFFQEPFSVLEEELRKLWTKNKEVYCSLVFCMLLNGKIGKDFLDVNFPKDEKFSIIAEACGLDTNISRKVLEEGLISVVGTYVSYENGIFSFIHDAFLESISSNFAKLNPVVMFSCCDIDLIRDRVRINSRLPDDDENVIVINQDKFEVIAKRVLTECEKGRFSNVLLSHFIKNEEFVEYLGKHTKINTIMKKVSEERRVKKRTIYYFVKSFFLGVFCCGMCTSDKSKKTNNTNNNKIDETNAALKQVIHTSSRQSTFIHWILASGCYRLFRYFWVNISKNEQNNLLSRDWKFKLTKPFFPLAILGGNNDIIRTLHSSGADINCFSYEGETPLSITAKSGRVDIATDLINWGADVNQADMCGHRFPSYICVEYEHVEVLKLLLKNNCDVNLVDIYGRSSTILLALMTRKRNIANLLLEFDSQDHPLHAAILNGDVGCIKTNLENEDINSQTKNGLTPLHYSTQINGTLMIKLLLGDHENLISNDEEQLMIVGSSQERPLLHSMVANINLVTKNGLTPLHLAVLNDHVEAVKLLLQRNPDGNVKDQFGRIPLHYSQNPVISSLLLDRKMSRSIVEYSAQGCSVIPENKSDAVVVNIVGDQEHHGRTLPWCTVFRNVAWYILPFKKYIYRGSINQPDNQGNTPLHVIVGTSRDLRPNIKTNYDSKGNIKLSMNHGGNIYLRNDDGYFPSDLVQDPNDLKESFSSYTSEINRNRDIVIRKVVLLFSVVFCCALVISPMTMANNRNENNFLNCDIKPLRQNSHDSLIYYYFLVGVMFCVMNDVRIIRVVIQLWQTSCRYRIACLILLFIEQYSTVVLFVVFYKTPAIKRICLVSACNGLHLVLAVNIKKILSLEIKHLQRILIIHLLLSVYLTGAIAFFDATTMLVFVVAPLNNETTLTLNKTFGDIIRNGSLSNQTSDVLDTTSFLPSTNINCTERFRVLKQDFTSFHCTFMYIISISICLCIFQIVCEKRWIDPPNTKKAKQIIIPMYNYMINIIAVVVFNFVIYYIIDLY